jgi:hypothetical protein
MNNQINKQILQVFARNVSRDISQQELVLRELQNLSVVKHGAGSYTVGAGAFKYFNQTVTIIRNAEMKGAEKWIVYANFDKYTVCDPVLTYREALECAASIIANRVAEINEACLASAA